MAVVGRRDESKVLAERIRRQRHALHLSLSQAAQLADVSVGFLSMLENGSGHQPGYDRLARVAETLGLGPDLAAAVEASNARTVSPDRIAARLGACLAVARKARLGDLARATGMTVTDVRLALRTLREQLVDSGMSVVDSGVEAELVPLGSLAATAALIGTVRASSMTEPRMMVIAITAAYGAVTRRVVDEIRGVDSSELLAGLVEDGYLVDQSDNLSAGRPRVYRLTPRTLEEVGVETIEELRRMLREKTESAAAGRSRVPLESP